MRIIEEKNNIKYLAILIACVWTTPPPSPQENWGIRDSLSLICMRVILHQ